MFKRKVGIVFLLLGGIWLGERALARILCYSTRPEW
jgi:hypothetical protein